MVGKCQILNIFSSGVELGVLKSYPFEAMILTVI